MQLDKHTTTEKQGFTLIETIMYIAIIGVVMSGFIAFGLSVSASRGKTYVVQEVQSNARVALSIISRQIRQASDVSSPVESASSSELVLNMPGADPDITFNVVDGIIYLTEGVSDPIPLVSSKVLISNFQFTNLATAGDKDSIKIEFSIEFRNAVSIEYSFKENYHTAVTLRF